MSSKTETIFIFAVLAAVLVGGLMLERAQAAINPQINYQGKLTASTDATVSDGAYDVVFKLYTVAGGGSATWTESWTNAALWTDTSITFTENDGVDCGGDDKVAYTSGTNESTLAAGQYLWDTTKKESAVIKSVDTSNNFVCVFDTFTDWANGDTATNRIYLKSGLFSVMLGTLTSLATADFNQTLWLGVTVGSDSEMTPRKKLGTVPAAFEADKLDGVDSGSFARSDADDTISGLLTFTKLPTGSTVDAGVLYVNPANATADYTLFGIAENGLELFRFDADGDFLATGDLTVGGTFTMLDDQWLGLGSNAGRIEFDNQSTDEINLLSSQITIGAQAPVDTLSELSIISTGAADVFINGASPNNSTLRLGESTSDYGMIFWNGASDLLTISTLNGGNAMYFTEGANVGINTSAPDARLEINHATGDILRMTYNDSDGSAAYYTDFSLASDGDLTIDSSGGAINISDDLDVSGHSAFGGSAGINTYRVLNLVETSTATSTNYGIYDLLTLNPAATSDQTQYGMLAELDIASGNSKNFSNFDTAIQGIGYHQGTGTVTRLIGVRGLAGKVGDAGGTVTNAEGVRGSIYTTQGTITNGALLYAENPTGGGAIGTLYGLYIENMAAGTTDYAIYSAGGDVYVAGDVGIGATTPGAKLEIQADGLEGDQTPQLRISGSTDPNKRLLIGFDTTANYGWIQATITGTSWNDLALNPLGANVGIGTVGPDRKLDILDASNPQLRLTQADGTVYGEFKIDSSGNLTASTTGTTVTFSGDTVSASDFSCTDCLEQGNIGSSAIGQGELKTTTGEVSSAAHTCTSTSAVSTNATLPGGSYGFYPQLKVTDGCTGGTTFSGAVIIQKVAANLTTSYVTYIGLETDMSPAGSAGTYTVDAQQRYIQASPPYFFDGYHVKHFIYFLRDKTTNAFLGGYQAEDPPWENNGRDPQRIPHPFVDYFDVLPSNIEVAMINPEKVDIWKQEATQAGMSLLSYLHVYYEVDPADVALPTSPETGNPITLKRNTTWRNLRPKANPDTVVTESVPAQSSGEQADLAELYPASPLLGPGDIVEPVFAHEGEDVSDEKKDDLLLVKSKIPYSPKAVGIISANPAQILNTADSDGQLPLALAGRVPVKVSEENGPIEAGDFITSSSTPGVGMKATKAGRVVGMALESSEKCSTTASELCMILVFINPHWYGGGQLMADGLSEAELGGDNPELDDSGLLRFVRRALDSLGFAFENGIVKIKQLITEKIFARVIRVEKLEMVDPKTGSIYCVWVEGGVWSMAQGECEGGGGETGNNSNEIPFSEPAADEGATENNDAISTDDDIIDQTASSSDSQLQLDEGMNTNDTPDDISLDDNISDSENIESASDAIQFEEPPVSP